VVCMAMGVAFIWETMRRNKVVVPEATA